ncbi:hypothetical protein PCANC_08983 [Puccinia coronata f. sp. avenae]|uniref:Secreted protein n=1 Tax=Puccinia coronata f. sp. avenae TaxID=200324 RepID=A0A2N5VHV1_9BASI|nr:hypothetical protein PCANC_08983 [Puccinia coronata f. sp. avenae]
MQAALLTLILFTAVTVNVAAVGETLNCALYSGSPIGFTCDERPDIICTEGCTSFVTASECTSAKYPKKPVTTELCTSGFGRDTATAKACINGQGNFHCTGKISGTGVCHGCVRPNDIIWPN